MPLKILTQVQSSRPPKDNSLRKNAVTTYRSLRSDHQFYFRSSSFTQPQNSVSYNAFPLAKHPKSGPSRPASASQCNKCSLNPPNTAYQTASRSVQPSLHNSWQTVPTLYNVHQNAIDARFKKLTAVINTIKEINRLTALSQNLTATYTGCCKNNSSLDTVSHLTLKNSK